MGLELDVRMIDKKSYEWSLKEERRREEGGMKEKKKISPNEGLEPSTIRLRA
jgi:hypothetical protein